MTAILAPTAALALPFFLILAALSDARRFIIPNWTSLGLIGGFALFTLLAQPSLESILEHLMVGTAALGIGFTLFCLGFWGGGDGKLLAAAALWFDSAGALNFALHTTMAGGTLGVMALMAICFHQRVGIVFGLDSPALGRFREATPYGVAITIGALTAWPHSDLFRLIFL
ncbi:MAG: prepilin peptidase [Rhodobacteraceae bacterium]|nr:prepilin peptidase [Paracoccaceae bacterium]